jgi:hypothetical protein
LTPETFSPVGEISGVMAWPRAGRSIVWKPETLKRTLSPLLTVMPLGKYALTSTSWLNAFLDWGGIPMSTDFVRASAAAGSARSTPIAAAAV